MSSRRQRTRRIRSAVAAGTVSVFLALFGGIYAQQATSDSSSAETAAVTSSATSTYSASEDESTTLSSMTTRQS